MLHFLIVDNTKDLENAKMTPKLLQILDELKVIYEVVSNRADVFRVLQVPFPPHQGIILTGGPLCLSESNFFSDLSKNILIFTHYQVPILGICFGHQVMGATYGADIKRMDEPMTGWQDIMLACHELFMGVGFDQPMFQHHKDILKAVPYGFIVIAHDKDGGIQGIAHKTKPLYGVQFHPENSGEAGFKIIQNFVRICANT